MPERTWHVLHGFAGWKFDNEAEANAKLSEETEKWERQMDGAAQNPDRMVLYATRSNRPRMFIKETHHA